MSNQNANEESGDLEPVNRRKVKQIVKLQGGRLPGDPVPLVFDPMADVVEFHQKFGLSYDGPPRILDNETADFRHKFEKEELDEWAEFQLVGEDELTKAPEHRDPHKIVHVLEMQFDACLDQLYVLLGKAHLQGFTHEMFAEGWRRVHIANMAKERSTGNDDPRSVRKSRIDVVKPAGWVAPSHTDLVKDHAHK